MTNKEQVEMQMRSGWIRIFWAVLIVLVMNPCGAARDYSWTFAGWYGGGMYPDLAVDPQVKDRLYLVSDVAGIWRSDNGGERWYPRNQGLPNLHLAFVEVASADTDVLYAGGRKGLYVSRNGGAEWTSCWAGRVPLTFRRPDNYRSLITHPDDAGKVYVGTEAGTVLFSHNFGRRFSVLGRDKYPVGKSPVTALAMNIAAGKIYAASAEGISSYDLKVKRWKRLDGAPAGVTDMIIADTGAPVIWAAGEKEAWLSDDQGESWRKTSPVPRGKTFRLAPDPEGDVMYVAWRDGYNGGVILSRDGGKSWLSPQKEMLPDTEANPTRVWAAASRRVASLVLDPFHPQVLWRTDWWGVWRSDDGGEIWREKIRGSANMVGTDIAVTAQGDILVTSMDNGILRSDDGGQQYTALFPVEGYQRGVNGHVWQVEATGDGQRIVATSSPWGTDINQAVVSRDGGASFQLVRNGLPDHRPRENTMWAEGVPRALALHPEDPEKLFLGIDGQDGGGLFMSADGGYTWQPSSGQPGSRRIYNGLAVDPTNGQRLVWGACGDGGGVYISEDEGKQWKHVHDEVDWIFDVAISSDGTMFAGGKGGLGATVIISRDHGQHWQVSQVFDREGTVEAIAVDPDHPQRVALSVVRWEGNAPGKVYLSEDGGERWVDITSDLPYGSGAAAMAFDPSREALYLLRYTGSVYRMRLDNNDKGT